MKKPKAIPLTEAEGREFERLIEEGDQDKIRAFVTKKCAEDMSDAFIGGTPEDMRELILSDALPEIVRDMHFCLHAGREEDLQALLCFCNALIEGPPKDMTPHVILGFLLKCKSISDAREFHERERGEGEHAH